MHRWLFGTTTNFKGYLKKPFSERSEKIEVNFIKCFGYWGNSKVGT